MRDKIGKAFIHKDAHTYTQTYTQGITQSPYLTLLSLSRHSSLTSISKHPRHQVSSPPHKVTSTKISQVTTPPEAPPPRRKIDPSISGDPGTLTRCRAGCGSLLAAPSWLAAAGPRKPSPF